MVIYNSFQKLVVGSKSAKVTGRPTVIFAAVGRPPSRPIPGFDLSVDRPVDRGQNQSSLAGRPPGRSGPNPESFCSLDGRPPGRPALKPFGRAHLCTSVDRHKARSNNY